MVGSEKNMNFPSFDFLLTIFPKPCSEPDWSLFQAKPSLMITTPALDYRKHVATVICLTHD